MEAALRLLRKTIFYCLSIVCFVSYLDASRAQVLHHYFWANYHECHDRVSDALQWYQRLLHKSESSVYAYAGYIHVLAAMNAIDDILTLMPRVKDALAKEASVQLIFVQALRARNRTQEAYDHLFSIAHNFKQHPEITACVAQAYADRAELDNALQVIKEYTSVAVHKQSLYPFYLLAAQCHLKLSHPEDALKSLDEAIECYPYHEQAWLIKTTLLQSMGKQSEARAALQTAEREFGINPAKLQQRTNQLLTNAFQKSGNTQEQVGVQLFQQAIQAFLKKDLNAARAYITASIAHIPMVPQAHLLHIQILTGLSEYDQIKAILQSQLTAHPDDATWYNAIQYAAHHGFPLDHARALLHHAEQHATNQLLPLTHRIELEVQFGSPRTARQYLVSALTIAPDENTRCHLLYQRAVLDYDERQYNAMQKTIEEIFVINKQFAPACNLLGYYCATKLAQLERAHELAQIALQQDPINPYYLDTAAKVAYKQKAHNRALTLLNQAIKLAPQSSSIHAHLCKVHRALGNAPQAYEHAQYAQQHARSHRERKSAYKLLAQFANKR